MKSAPVFKRSTIIGLTGLVLVQILCAAFFILELATDVLGLRHWSVAWEIREALQIGASLGLLLGAVSSILLLHTARRRIRQVEQQLRAASGLFLDVMDDQFDLWGLSPAEKDVALFVIRGYSNQEIAEARGKSESTIKTQLNSVFRKADVSGRAALVSHFIDILVAQLPPAPTGTGTAAPK